MLPERLHADGPRVGRGVASRSACRVFIPVQCACGVCRTIPCLIRTQVVVTRAVSEREIYHQQISDNKPRNNQRSFRSNDISTIRGYCVREVTQKNQEQRATRCLLPDRGASCQCVRVLKAPCVFVCVTREEEVCGGEIHEKTKKSRNGNGPSMNPQSAGIIEVLPACVCVCPNHITHMHLPICPY